MGNLSNLWYRATTFYITHQCVSQKRFLTASDIGQKVWFKSLVNSKYMEIVVSSRNLTLFSVNSFEKICRSYVTNDSFIYIKLSEISIVDGKAI